MAGTAPQFQWYRGTPDSGSPISGAITSTYFVERALFLDAGPYYVVVSNPTNSITSIPVTVSVLPDTNAPTVLSAVRQVNRTNIIVTFSEEMDTNALDRMKYAVCTDSGWTDCLTVLPTEPLVFTNGGFSQVVLTTTMPPDVDQPYVLGVIDVQDLAGNPLAGLAVVPVQIPTIYLFQQGLDGYAGTVDTEIEADYPDISHGTDDILTTDNSMPYSQGLIRFDNLFGKAANQVPFGARINVAILRFYVEDPGFDIALHNMRVSWDSSSTWNSLDGGVATNDIEAEAASVVAFDPHPPYSYVDVDVSSSVRNWADGQPNYGWVLINSGTGSDGGFDWPTSENATREWRPALIIDWDSAVTNLPVEITAVPSTNHIVVNEGNSFAITFQVYGSNPHLLWFKDDVALPEETSATLARTMARVSDSGDYFLQVTNDFPSSTNSPVIAVTVLPGEPPAVISASASGAGGTALTTLTAQFSKPMDPPTSLNPANYMLSPAVSLSNPTMVNASTVQFTVNAPFGQRYGVTVTGVADVFGNFIPQPITLEVTSVLIIADWDAAWKYEASDTDLLTVVPPFYDPAYDDSLWASGPGLLGLETTTDTITYLTTNAGAINTEVIANQFTSYYRKTDVHWPFAPGAVDPAVQLEFRHTVDDGVVFHVNGTEAFRYKMPPAPVTMTHTTLADDFGFSDETVVATNLLPLSLLHQGNNIVAADLHAVATTSSDNVFGAQILAILPPVATVAIVSVPATNHLVVAQGDAFNLTFGVIGLDPQFQWFHDGVADPEATTSSYQVTRATLANAGDYYLRATDAIGNSTNSPVITVEVIADTTAPMIISAVRQFDETTVDVIFSEGVDAQEAANPTNYVIAPVNGVVAVTLSVSNTVATIKTADPLPSGSTLTINNVTDPAGNALYPNHISIATATGFQQGVNGYTGTEDTYVSAAEPDATFGDRPVVLTDGESPVSHGLLRFDGLFGSNPGQVEAGATIYSATLRLYTTNNGDDVSLYQMATAWTLDDTWNTLGGDGITNDIVEPAVATISPFTVGEFIDIDVTASVQAWANGAPNYGWGLINHRTDGYMFGSSEGALIDTRPRLAVDWLGTLTPVPLSMQQQPVPSQIVAEGDPVSISVAVSGTDPQYRWQKDGEDIPGANQSAYTITTARPADAGVYRCVVSNDVPSTITSSDSVLRVISGGKPTHLLSAVSRSTGSLNSLELEFDHPLAAAGAEPAKNYVLYTLTPEFQLVAIEAAVLVAPATVKLTLATSLTFGTPYFVYVTTGVTDTAASPHPVLMPEGLPIVEQLVLLDWDSPWRYDDARTTADNYDGLAWFNAAFDDTTWPTGPGLLGFEDNPLILNALPSPIQTTLRPQNTVYLRSRFDWTRGSLPPGAELVVNHVIDDGLVCYFNGTEAFRFKMADGLRFFCDQCGF